ncbi:periplasmic heavy metal sensor [Pikeienuella sp. HZG-20]|uniref:periplasmic heavy metal sensor n=1 Tax=Paludibacillus litoralis TaxID=3133267 RepID=UPI0030EC922F
MSGDSILGMAPRTARWVLGLSLAVNFLVLGVAGGALWHMRGDGPRGGGFQLSRQMVEVVGPERRDAVRALVERPRKDDRRGEIHAWMGEVAALIDQAPFDPAAVAAKFEAFADQRESARAARGAAMLDALSLLTDAERAALAERMRAYLERRAKRD